MTARGPIKYMVKYLYWWVVKGYANHPYEIEARANEWPAKQGQ